MHTIHRPAPLLASALAASLLIVSPARASELPSYRIVDLGNPTYLTDPRFPYLDNSGNLINGSQLQAARDSGGYEFDTRYDTTPGRSNVALSQSFHLKGGSVNLLPASLQDPARVVFMDFNASGQLVGNRANGPAFVYSAASGQTLDVQGLPGETSPPFLRAINNAGQIIGDNRQPVFYSSPTAVPVPVAELLPANSGWQIFTVSDINEQGIIVGVGYNPAGEQVIYELIPVATPEPSALLVLVMGGIACAGRHVHSRFRSGD